MKKEMFEIRWHGRGGQGAKTASQFLAEAALNAGKFIQAFPEYGPERAGAPMKAYTRISGKRITIYSSVISPDAVVVIDPTLIDASVVEGIGADGILVVNSGETPDVIRKKTGLTVGQVAVVDATAIALETIGAPMPNTPMMGALIKCRDIVALESIFERIRHKFLKKIGEEKTNANIAAVKRAFDETVIG